METKHIADYRSHHDVLVKPLTKEEVKVKATKTGTLKAKVLVSFNDLIDFNIDELNDRVSEDITGSFIGLTDISYRVAGRTTNNEVIVEVSGNVDDFLSEKN